MKDKYPGYKKCFIDVETTGTDRQKNHIWQIAGVIKDIDGKILERFDYKFRPITLDHLEQGALDKTGMTIEKLTSFKMSANEAYVAFSTMLSQHVNRFDKKDKLHFIAYNAGFDSDFIREFFVAHGDNYYGSYFWHPAICIMQMAARFLMDVRGALPNFSLATLCRAAELGWDESRGHDAAYDIDQSIALFDYLDSNTKILGQ